MLVNPLVMDIIHPLPWGDFSIKISCRGVGCIYGAVLQTTVNDFSVHGVKGLILGLRDLIDCLVNLIEDHVLMPSSPTK